MRDFVNSSMWLGRGSSIVFDKILLGPLLSQGALISLRQALSWLGQWPTRLPIDGRSVLVGGLDTVLEVLPKDEAEQFTRTKVRRLISEFQDRCTEHALIFGLITPSQRVWEDPVTEHVFFINRDDSRICLSTDLWNGSAVTDVGRLIRTEQNGAQIVGGYYAPRS